MRIIEEANLENAKAQMRKGILEFAILLVVARGAAYSSDILDMLKRDDLLVVEGTLYPLLSRLKVSGLVEYTWEESSSGPPRKYYRLTERGTSVLEHMHANWKELSTSINSLIKAYEKNS